MPPSPRKDPVLFHVGDILSVMLARPLSLNVRPPLPNGEVPDARNNGFGGVTELLNFMTGESVSAIGLIRATETVQPVLAERFPQLANIQPPDMDALTLQKTFPNSGASEIKAYRANMQEVWKASKHKTQLEQKYKSIGHFTDVVMTATPDQIWELSAGFLNAAAPDEELRQKAWRSSLALRAAKDVHAQKGMQAIIADWLKPIEAEHGRYLSVEPLPGYRHSGDEEELRRLKIDKGKHIVGLDARAEEGRAITIRHFNNVTTEEARGINAPDYPELAQAILAVHNHAGWEHHLASEQIVQRGEDLDVNLNTTDHDEATSKYKQFLTLFPKNFIRFASIEYVPGEDGAHDQYVIRIDAMAMERSRGNAPSAQDKLMDFVRDLTGTPHPGHKRGG